MRLLSTDLKGHRHSLAYNEKTDATILCWLIWAGYLISMSRADLVSVDKPCYQLDERIRVKFDKDVDSNFVENWVAIYRQENLDNLDNISPAPAMWVWSCGTQSCDMRSNTPTDGEIIFENNLQRELQSWPLNAGLYRAVLSGGDAPYSAHAVSEPFEIGCSLTAQADTVSVDKLCYELDEPIRVKFKDVDSNFVKRYRYKLFYSSVTRSSILTLVVGYTPRSARAGLPCKFLTTFSIPLPLHRLYVTYAMIL